MSQRATFVSEFIYNQAIIDALIGSDAFLSIASFPDDNGKPIGVAGKLGGLYGGEEFHQMEAACEEIGPMLARLGVGPIKFAVIGDDRSVREFVAMPK